VWCARELVGHEPFALLLPPDVLVQHDRGCLAQMIDAARDFGESANIIAVEKMPAERIHMYAVVGIGERRGNLFSVTQMVEKPPWDRAPSNLIITGRCILQPDIFDILPAEKRGAGGEIQLTDAMIELAKIPPFYGLEFDGRSFDCGSNGLSCGQHCLCARAQRHCAGDAGGAQAISRRSRPMTVFL
jgi:UTP--glucose-1-phosphate uridylyltransferase